MTTHSGQIRTLHERTIVMYLHPEIDLSPLGTACTRGKNAHVHMRINVDTRATGGVWLLCGIVIFFNFDKCRCTGSNGVSAFEILLIEVYSVSTSAAKKRLIASSD